MPNRLVRLNETLLHVKIGPDSITWGGLDLDKETCLTFPEYGFFKRKNERWVLPYAVGCQSPTDNWNYTSVLQGLL